MSSSLLPGTAPTTSPDGSKHELLKALVFFAVVFVFTWVILFTFRPDMVCHKNQNGSVVVNDGGKKLDRNRCFIGSMLVALLVILGIWASRNVCK